MRFLAVCALLLCACPGVITPLAPVAPLAPVDAGLDEDAGVAVVFAVGPAPLRRLTNSQYLNTLTDILGPEVPTLEAFPDDSPVGGFDNAAVAQTPSELRVARYHLAARRWAELATRDGAHLTAVMRCKRWATAEEKTACAESFLRTTGRRLFRRPLSPEESARFLEHFAELQAASDFEGASQLLLETLLQSPQFLYRPERPTRWTPSRWPVGCRFCSGTAARTRRC